MAAELERETVAHIARLARVHLTDEELDAYADQLGEIIGHFDVLDRVNTDGVEPTAQIQPLRNVMADDIAEAVTAARGRPGAGPGHRRWLLAGA